jgi:hypothetical protein
VFEVLVALLKLLIHVPVPAFRLPLIETLAPLLAVNDMRNPAVVLLDAFAFFKGLVSTDSISRLFCILVKRFRLF